MKLTGANAFSEALTERVDAKLTELQDKLSATPLLSADEVREHCLVWLQRRHALLEDALKTSSMRSHPALRARLDEMAQELDALSLLWTKLHDHKAREFFKKRGVEL